MFTPGWGFKVDFGERLLRELVERKACLRAFLWVTLPIFASDNSGQVGDLSPMVWGMQSFLPRSPLNARDIQSSEEHPTQKRISILVAFPDERLEVVVVQWDRQAPTVLVQLKYDPYEPIQFPGKRPQVPGNESQAPLSFDPLDVPLSQFLNPLTGLLFEKEAWRADILFSHRSMDLLQPEPGLVLPEDSMAECRTEALRALGIPDEPGIVRMSAVSGTA